MSEDLGEAAKKVRETLRNLRAEIKQFRNTFQLEKGFLKRRRERVERRRARRRARRK